jgi:peptide subunit release factor 1 (eRF1)
MSGGVTEGRGLLTRRPVAPPMLDDLLGRTELKERIAELEEELHHLERERDAESERRREAVAERQRAEERVNRLEDRIADLEGKLEGETDDRGDDGIEFRRRETLHGDRRDELLARLDSVETAPEGALTAVVPDGHDLPEAVRETFGDHAPLVARAAPCIAYTDDAGLVSATLRPAILPAERVDWGDGFRVDESWFRPTGRFAFALVRSDTFALGVYEGRERVSLRGFTTDVKSDHSKGGFSQGRFERIREGQIRDHLSRCRDAIEAVDADRRYVVGESTLLDEFDADATASVDATGDPDEAIDAAFRDFWSVRLGAV